jgi:hypothetical protein
MMNNFQIEWLSKIIKMMCDILIGSIYFKGMKNSQINGLHGVLAFYICYILGCFG